MKFIILSVLVLAAVSGATSQLQTMPPEAQRIRLQFKDSATYKEARDVDIKSAVLTRRLSSGSGSQFAKVRILLSNLVDDLCARVDAFEALSVSPLPLSTDADFILTLASFGEQALKKDIAELDLHKIFFAPEAPLLRTYFVAIEEGSAEQLFPNQKLVITNIKRRGTRTEITPRGDNQSAPTHLVLDTAPGWFIYHSAVKKPPMLITGSRGHAIISREGDSARINFRVRGGGFRSNVVAEGNVSLRVCPVTSSR